MLLFNGLFGCGAKPNRNKIIDKRALIVQFNGHRNVIQEFSIAKVGDCAPSGQGIMNPFADDWKLLETDRKYLRDD